MSLADYYRTSHPEQRVVYSSISPKNAGESHQFQLQQVDVAQRLVATSFAHLRTGQRNHPPHVLAIGGDWLRRNHADALMNSATIDGLAIRPANNATENAQLASSPTRTRCDEVVPTIPVYLLVRSPRVVELCATRCG